MARYHIDLLDNDGTRVASLENIQAPRLSRRRNQPGEISFQLPAADDKRQYLTLGRLVQLSRDGVVLAAGRVVKRDFSRTPWSITALTREHELNYLQTPTDWGPVWEGWDLADVVRDLLKGFTVERLTAGWDSDARIVSAVDVDRTGDPHRVILAREPYLVGRRFKAEGTVVVRFDAGSSGHAGWERVRWRERVGEYVHIYVSYRTSNDAASWSAWSTEVEAIDGDGVSYAETRGIALSGTSRYIEIRFRLVTDDQVTQNPDPAPEGASITYGYSPELQAVEVTRRYAGPLTAGSIPASTGIQVKGVEANNAKHLQVLQDLCEQYGYTFTVSPDGALSLYTALGAEVDRTAEIALVDGVNCSVSELADEDAQIVNDLTAYGAGEGLDRLMVHLRNEASIAALGGDPVGLRPGVVEFPDVRTLAGLQNRAQEYLDDHAGAPRFVVTVRPAALATWVATDYYVRPASVEQARRTAAWEWLLAMPGMMLRLNPRVESAQDVRLLDRVKVAVPRSGLVTTAVVEEEQRQLTSKGEEVTLGLNATLPDLLDRFRRRRRPGRDTSAPPAPYNLIAKGRPGMIQLTWQGSAEKFLIQHTTTEQGGVPRGWRVADEKTGNVASFNRLPVGSVHFFRVIAVSGGRRSAPSEWVQARADISPPAVPTGLTLSTGIEAVEQTTYSSVTASWNANTETDLSRYEVRWRRGTGEWNYISGVGLATSVKIWPVPGGQTIGVQVRAVNVDNAASDWSAEQIIVSARDLEPPEKPVASIDSVIRGVRVSIGRPSAADWAISECFIRTLPRAQIKTATPRTLMMASVMMPMDLRVHVAAGRQTQFERADLVAGATYWADVVNRDTSGNASAPSAEVSAVAGKADTSDVAFKAVSSALIVQKQESDVITTTSTAYAELADMTIGPISLQAGDFVLEYFKGSTWTTQDGRSSDCQFQRSDGSLSNQTRHTSAYADATGQVVLIWTWNITVSGSYTFRVLWKTTATSGNHSGMASRTHQIVVLRGG